MKPNEFPAWRYGPNGQSQIFNSEDEVPAGWHDHPSKVVTPERTGSKPMPAQTDKTSAAQRGSGPANPGDQGGKKGGSTSDQSNTLDAHGHPWDAKLHAKSQSKTKDGLWRMAVGKSRPAPAPGYPKPPLDL